MDPGVRELAFESELPVAAAPAVSIVGTLRGHGHEALLAGGCVRDLLLGDAPHDYDVATSARPETVCRLFRATRRVGAQFGVVLVRRRDVWIEVATFRSEGRYSDGRRPDDVTFTDAAHDAQRRDFTVNGMFIDPQAGVVRDYVGGLDDLAARQIRAIGEPAQRFAEDFLRMLRAVRFSARLGFAIEPLTIAAIRTEAPHLRRVARERVRDELVRMLAQRNRALAVERLVECALLDQLWAEVTFGAAELQRAVRWLRRLPAEASFALALAVLLAERGPTQVDALCRELTCSNEERATAVWLVAQQALLDDPGALSKAQLKRCRQHPACDALRTLAQVRYAEQPDGVARGRVLEERLGALTPAEAAPPPLVTGDDLAAQGVPPGPVYKRVLDALYEAQLNEELTDRATALRRVEALLRGER